MKKYYKFDTCQQSWQAGALLKNRGYVKTDDCYWTEVYTIPDSDNEVVLFRIDAPEKFRDVCEDISVLLSEEEPSVDAAKVYGVTIDKEAYPSTDTIKDCARQAVCDIKQVQLVRVFVMGGSAGSDASRIVYNAMRRNEQFKEFATYDVVWEWCTEREIMCSSVRVISVTHHDHGDGFGHFVIEAIINE